MDDPDVLLDSVASPGRSLRATGTESLVSLLGLEGDVGGSLVARLIDAAQEELVGDHE